MSKRILIVEDQPDNRQTKTLMTLAVTQASFHSQMWYRHRARPAARLAGWKTMRRREFMAAAGLGFFS
jgi:hypothetical protein